MADEPQDHAGEPQHEVIAMPARADLGETHAAPTQAHPTLSQGQWTALQNLALKQSGGDVPWINIADARALTDAGFAERTREGWNITQEGVAELAAEKRRLATKD